MVEGGVYTFGWTNTKPIYDFIAEVVQEIGKGSSNYNEAQNKLHCKMNNSNHEISFTVSIFVSRRWKDRYLRSEGEVEEIRENKEHIIYLCAMERVKGDELTFKQIKNDFLLEYCSSIFKGLPRWARVMPPDLVLPTNPHCMELLLRGFLGSMGSIPDKVKHALFAALMEYECHDDDEGDQYDAALTDFEW